MQPTQHAVPQLVDHLFRHTAGQMVATLTRILGVHNLQLAEDVVQDVLISALRQWPQRGIPDNPRAWLLRAARNRAIDLLRREQRFADRAHLLLDTQQEQSEQLLNDDQLTMLLLCCHPQIARTSQIVLTLKIVGGLSAPEIASALLLPVPTIAQRLVRAKRTLRTLPVPFALPDPVTIGPQRAVLLMTIYLIFNEGYSGSHNDIPVRHDLIGEALRLGELIAAHPATAAPETHALLALLWLSAARAPTRVADDGAFLLLEDQDRRRWDQHAIGRGVEHLVRAATGNALTIYHLQAGIAACHATATSIATTNWRAILGYYDQLVQRDRSPVLALNRAVAVAQVHGAAAGLSALAPLRANPQLQHYPLLLATSGVLHAQRGDTAQALSDLRAAAASTDAVALRHTIERRIAALSSHDHAISPTETGGT